MSCVGCNDGCFDESVQLAQGPAGTDGTDGVGGVTTAGSNIDITGTGTVGDPYVVSVTGIESDEKNVLFANTKKVDVTASTYGADSDDPVVSHTINGTDENINSNGDIIRLNFMLIGDYAEDSISSKYDFKISFGGQTVIDTSVSTIFRLNKNFSLGATMQAENATKVTLDLVVSNYATNVLTPVIFQTKSFGDRTYNIMYGPDLLCNMVLSDIAIADISANNVLELSLKSSDGSSNISFMYCEIIKLLKA